MRNNGMMTEKRVHIGSGAKPVGGKSMKTILQPIHARETEAQRVASASRWRMAMIAKGLIRPADVKEAQQAADAAAVHNLLSEQPGWTSVATSV